MTQQRKQRHAITTIEVVVAIVVCCGLLMLLVPALNSSRESARENLCRKNLRRMFVASETHWMKAPTVKAFGTTKADLDSWPIAVLRGLNEKPQKDGSRPGTLTCPSRPADYAMPAGHQVSHYAATIFLKRTEPVNARWMFRDRELDLPAYDQDQWATAATIELPYRLPNRPPELKKGPHAGGSYLYTARDGSVKSVTPQAATQGTE